MIETCHFKNTDKKHEVYLIQYLLNQTKNDLFQYFLESTI